MACGESTPKVSTKASASMWPSLPTLSIRSIAHLSSAREKSIGKNTTSRPFLCANEVASIEVSIAFSIGQR